MAAKSSGLVSARGTAHANRAEARSFHEYVRTAGMSKPVSDLPKLKLVFRHWDPVDRDGDHTASVIPQIPHPTSAAERWVNYVLGACRSKRDLRTLAIWARQIAVSYTTLCESCRLVHVQPRHARDFARVLRVVMMPSFEFHQLATFLDISDRRTLDSILDKAGFKESPTPFQQVSVADFLDNQQFVARDNTGLRIIRELLAST